MFSVRNSIVTINGVTITENQDELEIDGVKFKIEGANHLTVVINKDVKNVTTANGNIDVNGNVHGDVRTANGSIICGAVGGDVRTTMGNVDVSGDVKGDVSTTMGSVKIRRA